MKVELESALKDLGLAYIKVPSKDIIEGSKDERKSVTKHSLSNSYNYYDMRIDFNYAYLHLY